MPPGTAMNPPASRRLARIRAWLRGHPAAVTLAGTFRRARPRLARSTRSPAWRCGRSVNRRGLYRAASIGYLGNVFNGNWARGADRRPAPLGPERESSSIRPGRRRAADPRHRGARPPDVVHAVGPLGSPVVPLVCLAVALAVIAGLTRFCRDRRDGFWSARRDARAAGRRRSSAWWSSRSGDGANWPARGIGVDVSLLEAVALLIGLVVIATTHRAEPRRGDGGADPRHQWRHRGRGGRSAAHRDGCGRGALLRRLGAGRSIPALAAPVPL